MSDEGLPEGRDAAAASGAADAADPGGSRWRRVVPAAFACCAVVLGIMMWRGTLIVVRGDVVQPPWAVLATAAAALVTTGFGRSGRAAGRRAVVAVAAPALVVGLAASAFGILNATSYRVLPDASQEGCHVVVREDSFLMSGSGSVYALHGSTGFARRVASYQTDDGDRPFTYGSAGVTWRGEEATVSGPFLGPEASTLSAFGC